MEIFSKIAEQRIRDAMERGEFDNLVGMFKPLVIEDETWIPEDLRAAYRVLKNAGCVPPELELRKEVLSLRDLINTIDDDQQRVRKIRELNFKLMKLNEMRGRPLELEAFPEYEARIVQKFLSAD